MKRCGEDKKGKWGSVRAGKGKRQAKSEVGKKKHL